MLYIEIPRRPVPDALERAAREARDSRGSATSREQRDAAQASYDAAAGAIRAHCAEVGVDKVEVPMDVQRGGPEALEQFHFAQRELRRPTEE